MHRTLSRTFHGLVATAAVGGAVVAGVYWLRQPGSRALLDRLIHNSHRIELGGESMRKLAQSGQIG